MLDITTNPTQTFQPFKKRLDSLIDEDKLVPDLKLKSVYEYQSSLPTSMLSRQSNYSWDAMSQSWIPQTRSEIIYDTNGNRVQYLFQTVQQNNWVNHTRFEYNYSQNGYINRTLQYEWNAVQKTWDVQSKDTFLCDNKFNVKSGEYFLWNPTSKKWIKEILTEIVYNAKSQRTASTFSRWNPQFNNYFFEAREEITYHPNGKEFEIIESNWDDFSSDWIYAYKFTDYYDASDKLTKFQQNFFDGTSWIPTSKTEITYDLNNNPVLNINSLWNASFNKWETFYKWENEYNNLIPFQDILLPNPTVEESQREFNHLLLKRNDFSYNAGNPVNDAFTTYYYSDIQAVGTTASLTNAIGVYPNPVRDVLHIKKTSGSTRLHFKIFNAEGIELMSKAITSHEMIPLDKWPCGIYYYILTDDKNFQSGKIYKE